MMTITQGYSWVYWHRQSTETALLCVLSDIYAYSNHQEVVLGLPSNAHCD